MPPSFWLTWARIWGLSTFGVDCDRLHYRSTGADLFSLQGLRNLGPTLGRWRQEWKQRKDNWAQSAFSLPDGGMRPVGYVVQQHGVRLDRPVRAYDKWVNRMPEEYSRNLMGNNERTLSPDTGGR